MSELLSPASGGKKTCGGYEGGVERAGVEGTGSDGWSLRVFIRVLSEGYFGFRKTRRTFGSISDFSSFSEEIIRSGIISKRVYRFVYSFTLIDCNRIENFN